MTQKLSFHCGVVIVNAIEQVIGSAIFLVENCLIDLTERDITSRMEKSLGGE